MPEPHWENLKEIFHAALALKPDERDDYLQRACDGNNSLRLAVESLLQSHEEPGNFVDAPAFQAAAEMLGDGSKFKPETLWPTTKFFRCPQISRDGRQLLYSRGRITADIWIMNLDK